MTRIKVSFNAKSPRRQDATRPAATKESEQEETEEIPIHRDSLRSLLFKSVFRICVNLRDLRASPDSVAAGRAALQSERVAHSREHLATDDTGN
jgi:hypothetical protein